MAVNLYESEIKLTVQGEPISCPSLMAMGPIQHTGGLKVGFIPVSGQRNLDPNLYRMLG